MTLVPMDILVTLKTLLYCVFCHQVLPRWQRSSICIFYA